MKEQTIHPTSLLRLYANVVLVPKLFVLCLCIGLSFNQPLSANNIDSLKTKLQSNMADSARVDLLINLSKMLYGVDADEAIYHSKEAIEISKKSNDIRRLALAHKSVGIANYYKGNYVDVVDDWSMSLEAFRTVNDKHGIANLLSNLGAVFETTGGTENAMEYYLEALKISEEIGDIKREGTVLQNLGVLYSNMFEYEKSESYYTKALAIFKENNLPNQGIATISMNLSEVNRESGDLLKAEEFAKEAIQLFESENHASIPQAMLMLCEVLIARDKLSEALDQARTAYQISVKNNNKPSTHKALNTIGKIQNRRKDRAAIQNYKEGILIGETIGKNVDLQESYKGLLEAYRLASKYKEALVTQDSFASVRNHITNQEKDSKLSNLKLQFDLEKREVQIDQLNAQNELQELKIEKQKTSRNILVGLLGLVLMGAFGGYTYTKNRRLDKEVKERTKELSKSLNDLKATQNQLVHAEKMAALGELTAGIAHEIQNPLNFVNNFSEVSGELLLEVEEELNEGNLEDVQEIVGDLKQNLEKINHHGKRASGIVRGMLDHSRTGSGEKTATDINQLCDEFLRLSYHGLRAKDKSFNASFDTKFDGKIGLVDLVSQDFGRVILNLINNAFYAVDKKKKAEQNENFEPTVSITTEEIDNTIIIKVADNGSGIPNKNLEKIFQPFFTTKPTGEGTGLGLSLSYDIITKGHNGKLSVESTEGDGTTFTIRIPNTPKA